MRGGAMWRQRVLEVVARLSRVTPGFRGKARLQRLAQRVAGSDEIEVEIDGVSWRLDPAELIQFRLLWDGEHDGHVLRWLKSVAKPGEVVWDVGANIGDIALPLAKGGVLVEAFEPSPGVFSRLGEHTRRNPGLTVTARSAGLSDHDGIVRFYTSAERGNAGIGSLGHAANTVDEGVEVRVARGDSLVASGEVAVPQVIKMDIEGFEPEALNGLTETIGRARPLICVESSGYRLRERGLASDAIISILEKLDYRVTVLTASGERPVGRSLDGNVDLVGRPR